MRFRSFKRFTRAFRARARQDHTVPGSKQILTRSGAVDNLLVSRAKTSPMSRSGIKGKDWVRSIAVSRVSATRIDNEERSTWVEIPGAVLPDTHEWTQVVRQRVGSYMNNCPRISPRYFTRRSCETRARSKPPKLRRFSQDGIPFRARFSGGAGMPGHLEGGKQPLLSRPSASRPRVQQRGSIPMLRLREGRPDGAG